MSGEVSWCGVVQSGWGGVGGDRAEGEDGGGGWSGQDCDGAGCGGECCSVAPDAPAPGFLRSVSSAKQGFVDQYVLRTYSGASLERLEAHSTHQGRAALGRSGHLHPLHLCSPSMRHASCIMDDQGPRTIPSQCRVNTNSTLVDLRRPHLPTGRHVLPVRTPLPTAPVPPRNGYCQGVSEGHGAGVSLA